MKDVLKTLLISLIFISLSSCTAVTVVSDNKRNVEMRKINAELEIKRYELELKYGVDDK